MFFRRRTALAASGPTFLKPDGPHAFRVRVKTAKRGEVIEVRLSKSGDISPTESGYYVRKQLVGARTFDRATVEVTFGTNYANPRVEVEGGAAVPVSEWEDPA